MAILNSDYFIWIIFGLTILVAVHHVVYVLLWAHVTHERHYDRLLLAGSWFIAIYFYAILGLRASGVIDIGIDSVRAASRLAWVISCVFHLLYSGRVWGVPYRWMRKRLRLD